MKELSEAEKELLAWFTKRGGDGVFVKSSRVVLAAGEFAPFMRSTWYSLIVGGVLERYGPNNKRIRIKAPS